MRRCVLLALCSGLILCGISAPHLNAQSNRQIITYTPTDQDFPNPERGFYEQDAPLWLNEERNPQEVQSLIELRSQNISMLRWYLLIDEFRQTPLSEDVLAYIDEQFKAARQAGLKVIPRFAYNFPQGGEYPYREPDAPLDLVLLHIDQLRPILRANSDIIAFMETGFVGAWGEWHSSTNQLVDEETGITEASRRIIASLMDALPADRMIAMRYPPYKQQLYGESPTTLEESLQQTDKARMGAHNDCFLASFTDWGTYPEGPEERNALRNYLHQDNRFVSQGGETCNNGDDAAPYVGCDHALQDLALLRFSTLNRGYHPDVLQGWRAGACYEEIERRLGYRLVLTAGDFPVSGSTGQRITLTIKILNTGFASPYNPRDFEIILRAIDSEAQYRLALDEVPDARRWLPDSGEIVLMLSGVIPADAAPGAYEVLLNLPDPSPALRACPEYSIRLANANVWESNTGYNNLGAVIQIDH